MIFGCISKLRWLMYRYHGPWLLGVDIVAITFNPLLKVEKINRERRGLGACNLQNEIVPVVFKQNKYQPMALQKIKFVSYTANLWLMERTQPGKVK